MLIKPYNLTINLDKPTLVNNIIIKKGDHKSRRFVFNIISNNKCIDLEDIYTIAIKAIKPDETIIHDEVKIEDGKIYYDLIEQFTAAVGEVECELEIIGLDGGLMNSPSFYLTVQDTVYDTGAMVSQNIMLGLQAYVTAARDVLLQVQNIYGEFELSYGTVEEVLDGLEGVKDDYVTYLQSLMNKVEGGYFNGERGPQGENGADAIVTTGFGIIGFQINEGHLICYYYDTDPPPFEMDEYGHLVYRMEE